MNDPRIWVLIFVALVIVFGIGLTAKLMGPPDKFKR